MSKYANSIRPDKPKVKTWNMTEVQLNTVREEGVREGIATGSYFANAMLSLVWLLQLRDTFGFGRERLQRTFERVQSQFGEIVAGDLDYLDIGRALLDECGIRLTVEQPDGARTDMLDEFRKMAIRHTIRMEARR